MLVVGAGQNQYAVNNSLRFRSSASAYLSKTWSASGTTGTFSFWIKRGSNLGAATSFIFGYYNGSGISAGIRFSSDQLEFYTYNAAYVSQLLTTQVFRDPSAWYHIVCVWDTTQATSTNRMKMYVNGTQVTSFAASVYPAQNTSLTFATSATWAWANAGTVTSGTYNDMYLAEINVIDGQALTPSSFGANAGPGNTWQPIRYAGTYGTNGFYLPFSDTSALTTSSNVGLGKDFSGNANYWTTNNISITAGTTYDAMKDSPTLSSPTVANYAVLNPIYSTIYNGNVLAANLQINSPTTDGFCPATIASSSGKWYYEASMTNSTAAAFILGIVKTTAAQAELRNVGTGNGYSYLSSTGVKSDGSGGAGTAYGATFTTGDVIGVAYDLDGGTITFYKNGVSQGVAYTGITGEFMPAIGDAASGTGGQTAWINFGQRPFSYTPPSGYVALNTYNLPTPSLPQGNRYMDATLYTGTNVSNTIVNQAGFKPDLVWLKARSVVSYHGLIDSVRGRAYSLFSNATDAEATSTATQDLVSFNSNGFTVGVGAQFNSNGSGNTFVGWQWQAGQGTTSSNTSGTIPSTVSVNASAGFSIVTFTAQTSGVGTFGHGLGVAPNMVVVKYRNIANDWITYHANLTSASYYVALSSTASQTLNANIWNNTAPTSSVVTLGTAWAGSSLTAIAYCWAAIPGFSAFGSYTGNGSADGPFVYTGFRPKYVMYKCSSASPTDWIVQDTSRDPYNVASQWLYADLSSAETTVANSLDFLSNGFKIRYAGGSAINTNGSTYIYAAFAENPFKYASAR